MTKETLDEVQRLSRNSQWGGGILIGAGIALIAASFIASVQSAFDASVHIGNLITGLVLALSGLLIISVTTSRTQTTLQKVDEKAKRLLELNLQPSAPATEPPET